MTELTPAQLRDELKDGFRKIDDAAYNTRGSIDKRIAHMEESISLLAWAVGRLIAMLEERDATP